MYLYFDNRDNYIRNQQHTNNYENQLIPLDTYDGSEDAPKEWIAAHLLNAEEKSKRLKEMGYKQKHIKTPKNMSQVQYRNKVSKYKFTESFDKFEKK